MLRARNVRDKGFQEITQSTAVPARLSGVVPIGSPLSLKVLPSLETSVTRLARALLLLHGVADIANMFEHWGMPGLDAALVAAAGFVAGNGNTSGEAAAPTCKSMNQE
jgi:hypothetical protein